MLPRKLTGYSVLAIGVVFGVLYCLAFQTPLLTLWSAGAVVIGTVLILMSGESLRHMGGLHIALAGLIALVAGLSVSVWVGALWGLTGLALGIVLWVGGLPVRQVVRPIRHR